MNREEILALLQKLKEKNPEKYRIVIALIKSLLK